MREWFPAIALWALALMMAAAIAAAALRVVWPWVA